MEAVASAGKVLCPDQPRQNGPQDNRIVGAHVGDEPKAFLNQPRSPSLLVRPRIFVRARGLIDEVDCVPRRVYAPSETNSSGAACGVARPW
jgi:hypothetical protein